MPLRLAWLKRNELSSASLRNPSSVAVLLRRVDWNNGIMGFGKMEKGRGNSVKQNKEQTKRRS